MKTIRFPCGCSVTSIMHPPYSTMDVNVCEQHYQVLEVQEALQKLSTVVMRIEREKSRNVY